MTTLLRDVRSPAWGVPAPVVVLFLHGFGADEQDLPGLAPALGLDLHWASLRAPLDVGSGAAWFAVTTVVLAGFVLGAAQPGDGILADARPPVFWGRGAEDRVIAAPAVTRTASWLPLHTSLTSRVYPGLAHGISAAEVADVHDFLAGQLPSA